MRARTGGGVCRMAMSMSEEERVQLWEQIDELQSKMQTAVDQVRTSFRRRAHVVTFCVFGRAVHACNVYLPPAPMYRRILCG